MGEEKTPVELSGGEGFNFEDQVATYYLAHMLTGKMPLGADYGQVTKVDFQLDDSGWFIEDHLVQLETASKKTNLAISVKRDRQVTRNGFLSILLKEFGINGSQKVTFHSKKMTTFSP